MIFILIELVVIAALVLALVMLILDPQGYPRHRRRERRKHPVLVTLLAAALLIPAAAQAQADTICNTTGWCGRVTVNSKSAAKCGVTIDGDPGPLRYLAKRAGYQRTSTRHYKDTGRYKVSTNCTARKANGTKVPVGKWISVSNLQSVNLVLKGK